MTDILDSDLRPSEDSFGQGVADETVLLQVKRAAYYGMNSVGTLIWNGIQDGELPRNICASIARDFEVPVETVEDDARRFLEDLAANDIIILG